MAKRSKRIEALRRNPKNVRPEDLDVVLRAAGFSVDQDSTSHRLYRRGTAQLSVPQHRPLLKEAYVKLALAVLDQEGD